MSIRTASELEALKKIKICRKIAHVKGRAFWPNRGLRDPCLSRHVYPLSSAMPSKRHLLSRAGRRRGCKRGGSRSGLVLPFLSFLCPFFVLFVLSRFFWDFSDFSGNCPDWSVSSFSAYLLPQKHPRGTVPKGSLTQSDLSQKKWEKSRFGTPRFTFSQFFAKPLLRIVRESKYIVSFFTHSWISFAYS